MHYKIGVAKVVLEARERVRILFLYLHQFVLKSCLDIELIDVKFAENDYQLIGFRKGVYGGSVCRRGCYTSTCVRGVGDGHCGTGGFYRAIAPRSRFGFLRWRLMREYRHEQTSKLHSFPAAKERLSKCWSFFPRPSSRSFLFFMLTSH